MAPTTSQLRPGRPLAVIVRTSTKDRGYIFARDVATREEYFLHATGIPPDLWDALRDGDAITCQVEVTPKGNRGFRVARASAEEQASVAAAEEVRGNQYTDDRKAAQRGIHQLAQQRRR